MGSLMVGLVIVGFIILTNAVKVIREYERAVIFRLGRLLPEPKGPGLFVIIPFIDKIEKINLRVITMDVPEQEIITKDNVTIKVNAVVYFRVMNPNNAVTKVNNYFHATSLIAQTTLRSVLGGVELDALLSERESINQKLQKVVDELTDPWGIKVSVVEIKDVELPEVMKRAMAKQAEAERDRRAKIIAAEAEYQASEKLSMAAKVIEETSVAIQLRYLQTLKEIAAENNSTTIFPIPIDLFKQFIKK